MRYEPEKSRSGIAPEGSAGQHGNSGRALRCIDGGEVHSAQRRGLAATLAGGMLASALLWSGGVLAHCDPATGHFDCPPPPPPPPTDPVPGSSDKLYLNAISKQAATGTNGTKVKAEVVNQVYSNNAKQWYMLVDATLRLPAPGIANKAEAQAAHLTLRYFRFEKDSAYAECTLEPRKVAAKSAVFSVGLKANAAHTLLRWGRCDDLATPGFDSFLPPAATGDVARLIGPDGTVLAEFNPPQVVEVPIPDKPKKRAQPATAKLLEGGGYKVKKK